MPPLEKLRPDDHFMMLLEGDRTPMHIGALVVLEASAPQSHVFEALRDHFLARLPGTPLLRGLRRAPLQFDSDVWVRVDALDVDRHFVRHHSDTPMDDAALDEFVAAKVMERLDLTRPPFEVHILDNISGGRAALYVKVHHGLTDGIGFQTILGLLSDDDAGTRRSVPPIPTEDQLPSRHHWLALSVLGFRRQRRHQPALEARRAEARAALKDPSMQRPPTPQLSLSGPTSTTRSYTTITLSFERMRAVARALDGTLNDLFLTLVGTAMRDYLESIGDLPDTPLVANAARSYRRPEHGLFGNRIVAIHPHLGTHIADPIERLRSIQASMGLEWRRTPYDEALLNQPETPFGPRIRRERFAQRRETSGSIIPGNISVSNVPGPAHDRTFAGFRQLANFPAPLLGSGRAANFTARRNAGSFDVGCMVDRAKIPHAELLARPFREAFELYSRIAG